MFYTWLSCMVNKGNILPCSINLHNKLEKHLVACHSMLTGWKGAVVYWNNIKSLFIKVIMPHINFWKVFLVHSFSQPKCDGIILLFLWQFVCIDDCPFVEFGLQPSVEISDRLTGPLGLSATSIGSCPLHQYFNTSSSLSSRLYCSSGRRHARSTRSPLRIVFLRTVPIGCWTIPDTCWAHLGIQFCSCDGQLSSRDIFIYKVIVLINHIGACILDNTGHPKSKYSILEAMRMSHVLVLSWNTNSLQMMSSSFSMLQCLSF